jgi:signal transduction histidine kinase
MSNPAFARRAKAGIATAARPVWYRTLYWRVALGTLGLIVVLLAAQAALVLWVVGQADRSVLARPPLGLARLIASDLGAALEAEPAADAERLLRESFGRVPQNVFIVFTDGRVITNRRFTVPEAMLAGARRGLADRDGDAPREGMRMRTRRFPTLRVGGELKGIVVVLPFGGPIEAALATYGPALLGAGGLLLVVGTLGVMFFVLAPARRRLDSLERAAAALGAGDTTARAPEGGGDEIAALSSAFNRMAAELEGRLGELQRADRVRRQLLADVSHELMTPLTAIRGYLETLGMPNVVRDETTRERYVRIVTEETLRLEAIIGDLLDLARLEGRGVEIEATEVPVSWLFERVAERHGVLTSQRGITMTTTIDPGAERVRGDGRRLEQALQNLVANAVRHTPDGGRVAVTASPDEAGVRLRVEDTGAGIPPEHLPLVFDRFYKIDQARSGSAGSGLGLSIVKAVVERHGGRVAASAAQGGGARFDIILPAS